MIITQQLLKIHEHFCECMTHSHNHFLHCTPSLIGDTCIKCTHAETLLSLAILAETYQWRRSSCHLCNMALFILHVSAHLLKATACTRDCKQQGLSWSCLPKLLELFPLLSISIYLLLPSVLLPSFLYFFWMTYSHLKKHLLFCISP